MSKPKPNDGGMTLALTLGLVLLMPLPALCGVASIDRPAGTYQILLRGATKMAYARNPQAAELAKADH